MFYGTSRHTLDDKKRIHLPARLLEHIPQADWKLTLTVGLDGCLFLFDQAGWKRLVETCQGDQIGGPELRALQRAFFSNVVTVVPDGQRRMVIPDELAARVQLGKEVVVVGAHNRIEIWPAPRWDEYQKANQDKFELFANQILSGTLNRSNAG